MNQQQRLRRPWIKGLLVIVLLLGLILTGVYFLYRAVSSVSHSAPAAAPNTPSAAANAQPAAPTSQNTVQILPEEAEPTEPDADESEPAEPTEPPVKSVTLMALGDNLIHNSVYWSAELADGSYDFSAFYRDIAPIVAAYDFACINQETIYVSSPALYDNYPHFGSPTAVGDALVDAGFDIVTHASNHAYDKLDTGILDSVSFWRENYPQMHILGIHDSQEDADRIRVAEKDGIRLALLNYTYGLNSAVPQQPYMVDQFPDHEKILRDLSQAEQLADLTIVFAHWGEEGQYQPNDDQRALAQFLADHGADLIIGAHPHVLQPLETITSCDGKTVPVFWSLGNFLSHQVSANQMLGGMASVSITKDEGGTYVSSYSLIPTINVIIHRDDIGDFDYRPMLLEHYTSELAQKHRIFGCTPEAMWELYSSIISENKPNG